MEYALGILVSLIVQAIKKYGGTTTIGTLVALAVVSLIGAGTYVYFVNTPYWDVIVTVILTASTFYALLIKRFESES